MNNRILITYATRTGSVVEVAKAIGEVLASRGFLVDIRSVKEKPTVGGYSAVILGSAVRMGGWLPEAMDFVKNNRTQLNKIRTAIFTLHMLNTGEDELSHMARQAYIEPVRQLITPVAEAFFVGSLDIAKLSFVDRILTRMLTWDAGPRVGDFRNWDKIRGWAQTVFA